MRPQLTNLLGSHLGTVRRKSAVPLSMLALSMLLTACVMDAPSPVNQYCRQLGGQYETRLHPDVDDSLTGYCVFTESGGCYHSQFYDGTCTPPGMEKPISPSDMNITVSPLIAPNGNSSLAAAVSPAQSLEALVSQASLIVVGEVGPVVQYLDFAAYGEDGQLREQETDPKGNLLPGIPATDFTLVVEEVIRDDETVASGEPIILRMPGHATAAIKMLTMTAAYPYSFTGDRHLFLLTPNPDGKSYGLYYGPWSRLIIDGEILRVSDGQRQLLHFPDYPAPITLEEFRQVVQSQ